MPEQIRALTSLALSDKDFALAALAGRDIVFYDLHGSRRKDLAPVAVGSVNAMSRVPDDRGDRLATVENRAEVALWDPRTRTRERIRLREDVGDLTAMTTLVLPDRRKFVVAGTVDGAIVQCDVAQKSWVRPTLDAGLQAVFALEAMPLADGRTLFVSAGEDRALRVWDPTTRTLLHTTAAAHEHAIRALVFIPDYDGSGERLASADEIGVIKLWQAGTRLELIRELSHRHHRRVSTLAVMPGKDSDPPTLISAGKDEFVRRWTIDGSPIEPASPGHIGSVTAVVAAVTPDGDRVLASAGRDATVRIWNVDSGQAKFSPESIGRIHSLAAVDAQDTVHLAASGDDGGIRLHSVSARDAHPVVLPRGHQGPAFSVMWLPDRLSGLGLCSVGFDGRLLHWGQPDTEPVELATGLGLLYAVSDIALPDGALGIACAGERGVFVVDPANHATGPRQIFSGSTYALVSGELTDRSQGVAAAGGDGVIRLLNPAKAEPVHTWAGHEGPVRCLTKVVRPGERNSLLSAGIDGTVRIWDTRTGSRVLARHDDAVLDLVVLDMPDGRQLLISTGEDRQVQYLDLNAIDEPGLIDTDLPVVSALCAFTTPDGLRAAVGSVDGKIRQIILDAEYGDLPRGLRSRCPA